MTTIRQGTISRFTTVSNDLAQNKHLSLRAKGLMVHFLSLPNDWKIHINQLSTCLLEGRRVIQNAINELKGCGYIHHHKMGFEEGWNYFVFDSPITENEFKIFLRTIPVLEQFENANSSRNVQLLSTKSKRKYTKKDLPHKRPEPPKIKSKKEEEDFSSLGKFKKVLMAYEAKGYEPQVLEELSSEFHSRLPGTIADPFAWAPHVIATIRQKQPIKELVERRKALAHQRPANFAISGNFLIYTSGAIEKKVALASNDPFWENYGLDLKPTQTKARK